MTAAVDREQLRDAAKRHVAEVTGADVDDLTVLNDSVVEYDVVGERYYHAKVLNRADNSRHGAFLDVDGDAADRDSVERRVRDAREQRYGSLAAGLHELVRWMDRDETVEIAVWTNIDRAAAKEAARKEASSNVAERKRAISEETRRRSRNASNELAAKLRDVEGVEIEEVGSALPRVVVTATPPAIERIDQLEEVWGVFDAESTFVEDSDPER